MATILGQLLVKIGADTAGIKQGVKEAKDHLDSLHHSIMHVLEAIALFESIKFGYEFVKSSLEAIDVQSKLAYRLQGTIAALQTLEHAAKLGGVPVDTLTTAAGKLNQALAEAGRTSDGKTSEALKRLGLNAKDLLKLDIDKRLETIAQRMFDLGYTTSQQADVLKAFNIRGQALINVLEGGGKLIREARHDVHDFGVELSAIDGIKVEQANEAWIRAHLLIQNVAQQLAVQLAPFIKEAGDQLAEAGKEAGGFGKLVANAIRLAVVGISEFTVRIYDARVAWLSFRQSVEEFKSPFTTKWFTDLDGLVTDFEQIGEKFAGMKKQLGSRPDPAAIISYFDAIVAKSEAAAKEVEESRKKMLGTGGPKLDPFTAEQRKALQDRLNNLKKEIESEDLALLAQKNKQLDEAKDLERKGFITKQTGLALKLEVETNYEKKKKELVQSMLEETILKEDELNQRAFDKRIKDLEIFEKNRTVTAKRAAEIRKKLEEKHAIDMHLIAAKAYSGLANIVDTSLGQISQLIGQHGGAAFEVMKAISMATALVKGYEAVVSAYAAGNAVGGPVVGATFAAIAAAGVAAQIAALAAVKPGGAAAAPGSPTSAGADNAVSSSGGGSQGDGSNQTLFIQGLSRSSLYSGDAVRELVGHLIQYQRDGGKIVMA